MHNSKSLNHEDFRKIEGFITEHNACHDQTLFDLYSITALALTLNKCFLGGTKFNFFLGRSKYCQK